MAGIGPPPKDPSRRARANKDPVPTRRVSPDGKLRGPALPSAEKLLGEGARWHPRTAAWWRTWRRSAQAQTFTETDWDFLVDTALMHHTMWTYGRWEFASELRLRVAKFGATPEDRLRLRLQIGEPGEADSPGAAGANPGANARQRYGGLRVVDDRPAARGDGARGDAAGA